jgi:hypothetical protein
MSPTRAAATSGWPLDQINVIPPGKASAFVEALETLGTET